MARPSPPTERVVGVLNLLAAADGGMTASDVARRLKITMSTCVAVLRSLADADYVERDDHKLYQLGPGLVALAEAMHERFPLLGRGDEELHRLAAAVGCAVTLTRITTDHLRVVAAVGPSVRPYLGVAPGDRFPLSPPYGAIAMAWKPEAEIDRWLSGWQSTSSDEHEHERRVMSDIRTAGVGVWSFEPYAIPVSRQIRAIIDDLADDPSSAQLREQLTDLFAMFGRRGYTRDELTSLPVLSVGYALAAVFGPDRQPRYQIDVQLLRRSMTSKAVEEMLVHVAGTAAALTDIIEGEPPAGLASHHRGGHPWPKGRTAHSG